MGQLNWRQVIPNPTPIAQIKERPPNEENTKTTSSETWKLEENVK